MPDNELHALDLLTGTPATDVPTALLTPWDDALHASYRRDESRKSGAADAITLPCSTAEVVAAVKAAANQSLAITISGGRTGVAAGAVPPHGLVLSLERMNQIHGLQLDATGHPCVRCAAGVTLAQLQDALRRRFADSATWDDASRNILTSMHDRRWFFPPDPTETSATIGGVVAANASGAHTFLYGPARNYVAALDVVLADGSLLHLTRGRQHANADGSFILHPPQGAPRRGCVPLYSRPTTKNAAGYHSGAGMDLIDLFIGSEGTLGIITEAVLRLEVMPETQTAVLTFWRDDHRAIQFVRCLRERKTELGLEAIEYFDQHALELLRQQRHAHGALSGVPECLPGDAASAIYLDIGVPSSRQRQTLADIAALARQCGGNPDTSWVAVHKEERERFRRFRHALPEAVNARIATIRQQFPEITKLGTDMAVPDEHLETVLELYRSRLRLHGLTHVIFGHIGDNHLHVNIIPGNPAEYALGRELYAEFAREVVQLGGSPAAEHGIGKLKVAFLRLLYGADGVAQMRAVKAVFDPHGRLGPGTLF